MKQQIVSAFDHRQRPIIVTTVAADSTLRRDALHFKGMDWTQVTAVDWAEWSDAYYGLSPEAFRYFLPSILVLSLDELNLPFAAADALVMSLDTSADPGHLA